MKVEKTKQHKLSSVLQVRDGIQDPTPHQYLSAVSMHPAFTSDTTCFAPLKRIILAFCWSMSLQRAKEITGRLQNNYLNQRAEENNAQDSNAQKKPAALHMWEV